MRGLTRPSDGLLERGRALFNEGRFFEAHEAWEELWRAERGQTKKLLQGLIQIAAGFHKARAGAARPCVGLLESGLEKLGAAREQAPALAAFAEAVRVSLGQARRWERGEVAGVSTIPIFSDLEGVK